MRHMVNASDSLARSRRSLAHGLPLPQLLGLRTMRYVVLLASILLASISCNNGTAPARKPFNANAATQGGADATPPHATPATDAGSATTPLATSSDGGSGETSDADSAGNSAGDLSDSPVAPFDGNTDAFGSCADGPEFHGNLVGLTKKVTARLREIARRAKHNDQVFLKVGDSITEGGGPNGSFGCFSHFQSSFSRLDLAGRDELRPTIEHFDKFELRAHAAQNTQSTSWDRASTAARVGVASDWPLQVDEADGFVPLAQELAETDARFAVVMLGTNDVGSSPLAYGLGARGLREYAHNILSIVDHLTSRGVIPVLTYIPPVNSTSQPYRKWFTAAYVAVLRGIATLRQIPTIDFYSEMSALGDKAYRPKDPLHPSQYPESACVFHGEALEYGHNLRNLRSLEVLDKLRRTIVEGEASADSSPNSVCGSGTALSPYEVPDLPFAMGVSFDSGQNTLSNYESCGGKKSADRNERLFRLDIEQAIALRAIVVPTSGECDASTGEFTACDASRDVNISLFKAAPDMRNCVRSHSTMIEQYLEPGTWYLAVDSYSSAQPPKEAIVSIHRCHPDDTTCKARP